MTKDHFGIIPPPQESSAHVAVSKQEVLNHFLPTTETQRDLPDRNQEAKNVALELACMYENLGTLPPELKKSGLDAYEERRRQVLKDVLPNSEALNIFINSYSLLSKAIESGINPNEISAEVNKKPAGGNRII